MIPPSPDYLDEALVVLAPRIGSERYDATIYAAPQIALDLSRPPTDAPAIAGLPQRGVEPLKIRWAAYREYLEAFHDGEKAAYTMRERLVELMPPGLRQLFGTPSSPPRRTRIWWSCASPETEELPWELLIQQPELSLARGIPGAPRALIPRRGDLRLAVIAKEQQDVDQLQLASAAGVVVEAHVGVPVRRALDEVMRSGAELIHIIADGTTLPSWDGVLEIGGEEPLSPSELAGRMHGSRIACLGLSPARGAMASTGHCPTAFRAFSHVAWATECTSVVAQLGPWIAPAPIFAIAYAEMARTCSIEHGMIAARKATSGFAPLALFLRQRLGREIANRSRGTTEDPQVTQQHADVTKQLFEQLRAVEQSYGNLSTPLSGSDAFREQEAANKHLDEVLAPWTKLEDDER